MRNGVPWRDLAPDYGDRFNVDCRFCRCRDRGIWEKILEELTIYIDFEWLMIDATHCKVHPHSTEVKGAIKVCQEIRVF